MKTNLKWMCFLVLILSACADGVAGTFSAYHVGNSLTGDLFTGFRYSSTTYQTSQGNTYNWGVHFRPGTALTKMYNVPDDNIAAASGGTRSVTGTGTSFSWHDNPNNVPWTTSLPGSKWDAVTMQPYPGANGVSGDSTLGGDTTAINGMIASAKSNPSNASTRFFIYQAWPKIIDYNDLDDYNDSWLMATANNSTQVTKLARSYFTDLFHSIELTNPEIAMIPVGEVFYALDAKMRAGQIPGFTSIRQLHRDVDHLNTLGSDIAGYTAYATIYKDSPLGLASNPSIGTQTYDEPTKYTDIVPSAAALQIMQQTVWEVVNQQSEFTQVPEPAGAALLVGGFVALLGSRRILTRKARAKSAA